MSSTREISGYRIEQSYQKLNKRISSTQYKQNNYFVYTKYVAILIILIGISALMYL